MRIIQTKSGYLSGKKKNCIYRNAYKVHNVYAMHLIYIIYLHNNISTSNGHMYMKHVIIINLPSSFKYIVFLKTIISKKALLI